MCIRDSRKVVAIKADLLENSDTYELYRRVSNRGLSSFELYPSSIIGCLLYTSVFRLILFCGAKRWLCSGAVGREMVWFLILAAVIVAVVGYLIYVNRNIRLVRLKLKYHHLPIEFDGYRILLISDLHDKRFGRGNLRLLYRCV